jgi:hypothetical protein
VQERTAPRILFKKMDYQDFEIELTAEATGRHLVRVSRSPAGQSSAEPLDLALTSGEIDRLAAALGRAAEAGRRSGGARDLQKALVPDASEPSLTDFGDRLFRALLPEAARSRYHESFGLISERESCGLRIRLHMDLGELATAQVHAVPWELLHVPGSGDFLGLSRQTSIVRYLALGVPGDRPPAPLPPQVLVIVGDGLDLDLKRELQNLQGAWGAKQGSKIKVTLLRNPTLEAVRDRLLSGDFHVFHYMGHGGFDARSGEGKLAFSGENGQRVWVTGSALADELRDRSSLRLVFLNACLTARASSAGPYAGVATALLRAGIPAVVAMQFPISDAAAIAFSRAFYRRLAASDTVDAAVTEGRLAVHRLANREWATPVLFERLTSGKLFQAPVSSPKMRWSWTLRALAVVVMLFVVGVLGWLGTRDRLESPKPLPVPKRELTQMKPVAGSAGTEIGSGARVDSSPQSTVPARSINSSPMQTADRPNSPPSTITQQDTRSISTPQVYTLKDNDAIFIQELQTWASVEFSQVGREPYVTLHLTPPYGPVMNHAILGPTVLDVPQVRGTRRFQIQNVDWSERKLTVSVQPADPR